MEVLAAGLDETFTRRPPDALRAAAERAFGARYFSIDALLPSARRELIGRMAPRGPGAAAAAGELPGASAMREGLRRAAAAFADKPGPGSLQGLNRGLDEARRSGLHLSLWELQDFALQGLKRWAGPAHEDERRALARALGLSDALFLWPPAAEPALTPGDSNGDTEPSSKGQ